MKAYRISPETDVPHRDNSIFSFRKTRSKSLTLSIEIKEIPLESALIQIHTKTLRSQKIPQNNEPLTTLPSKWMISFTFFYTQMNLRIFHNANLNIHKKKNVTDSLNGNKLNVFLNLCDDFWWFHFMYIYCV